MRVPWELNPQPFVLLTQFSTTEPQEHRMPDVLASAEEQGALEHSQITMWNMGRDVSVHLTEEEKTLSGLDIPEEVRLSIVRILDSRWQSCDASTDSWVGNEWSDWLIQMPQYPTNNIKIKQGLNMNNNNNKNQLQITICRSKYSRRQ